MSARNVEAFKWCDLTLEQLLHVWSASVDHAKSKASLYLDLFKYFMHMEHDCHPNLLSPKGAEHVFIDTDSGERFCVSAQQLYIYCAQLFEFLDHPEELTSLPEDEPDIEVSGLVLHLPEPLLNNLTYQQFQMVQQCTDEPYRMLAHILTPMTERHVDERTGIVRNTYRYDISHAESMVSFLESHMGEIATPLYHLMCQLVQGSLAVYQTQFRHIFSHTGSGKSSKIDFIQEISTLNNMAKWSGLCDPEKVLGLNLPIAFDILDKMTQEAEQMESMRSNRKK